MPYTERDLEGFGRAQRLAYDCVTAVERELEAGITERETAAMMRRYLKERGVEVWFHKPFAWFGDRTAFEGFRTPLDFMPTRRELRPGMPVILDVAPVLDGYAADIGYACAFGDNPLHKRLMAQLEPYRALVLDGVRKEKTLQQIYRDVDALIDQQGLESRHARYPFGVIAHRVERFDPGPLDRIAVGGFGLGVLRWIARESAAARRGAEHHSPLWNGSRFSDHRATPGLWAVEPHVGYGGIGVKFEELLLVTDTDARWLDDELPHVRRWRTTNGASAPLHH